MFRLSNLAKPALLAVAMIVPNAALAADSPVKTRPTVSPTYPVPSIPLDRIAKEVAPNYFELDPALAEGKHITLPTTVGREWSCCIGKRDKDGGCKGIYISTK